MPRYTTRALLVFSGIFLSQLANAQGTLNPKPHLLRFGGYRAIYREWPAEIIEYPEAHWWDFSMPCDGDADDPAEFHIPVAYYVDERVIIERVEFCDAIPANLNTLIDARGVGPDGHVFFGEAYIDLPNNVVYASNLWSSVPLQNMIRFYDEYQINWTLTYRGSIQQSFPAGTTRNRLYVTVGDPIGTDTRLLESMVHLSCDAADGVEADDPLKITTEIWMGFTSLNVHRKPVNGFNYPDGAPLFYWGDNAIPGEGFTAQYLLNRGWGTCSAWSDLLHRCMTLQMVKGGTRVQAEPMKEDPFYEDIIIVREFTTTGASSGFPKYPYLAGDFMAEDGIPAQNNFDPATVSFNGHCINSYLTSLGVRYLDPSYGVEASSLVVYEDQALFAVGRPHPYAPGIRVFRRQTVGMPDLHYKIGL